jgi:hypothetical protein
VLFPMVYLEVLSMSLPTIISEPATLLTYHYYQTRVEKWLRLPPKSKSAFEASFFSVD